MKNIKKILFIVIIFFNLFTMTFSSYAAARNISKEERQKYFTKLLLIQMHPWRFDGLRLMNNNLRYKELAEKSKKDSLTMQETEEAANLLDEYSCKIHAKEIENLLQNNGKKWVVITFNDDYCQKCTDANLILDKLSKEYNFQLDTINSSQLEKYIKDNNLEGKVLSLFIEELKDEELKERILQKGNVPLFAYEKKYGFVLPLTYKTSSVKNACYSKLVLALFADITK